MFFESQVVSEWFLLPNMFHFGNWRHIIERRFVRGATSCPTVASAAKEANDFPPNWNPKCCMLLQIVCQVIYRIVRKHLWSTGQLFQIQRLWSNKNNLVSSAASAWDFSTQKFRAAFMPKVCQSCGILVYANPCACHSSKLLCCGKSRSHLANFYESLRQVWHHVPSESGKLIPLWR